MTGLNRCFMVFVFVMSFIMMVNGQNTYLNKKVKLPTGQIELRVALKFLSNQTGCVFSYDPTKILDKQKISISTKGTLSLSSALLEVLPKNIQFILKGKYIVLQETKNKAILKSKTTAIKLPEQNKLSNQRTKGIGKIDKNPDFERLVLPPSKNEVETKVQVQKVDSIPKQVIVSNIAQDITPIQRKDSNLLIALSADTISKKEVIKNKLQETVEIKQPANKDTTARIEKTGLANFFKKNGYLETGLSINKQIGAISIHAGLYNVYSIFSIGSDYHNSYLFGIGIGAKIKLDNHFSLNFDLLQNSLIAGKSYLLNVRASNTQLSPILNFTILKSFKLYAGPTLNLIKSSYEGDASSTDLGVLVGIGFSAGIKIDLKTLFSKHS